MKKLILLTGVLLSVICFETNARSWKWAYKCTQNVREPNEYDFFTIPYGEVNNTEIYYMEPDFDSTQYTKGMNDAPNIEDGTVVYQPKIFT